MEPALQSPGATTAGPTCPRARAPRQEATSPPLPATRGKPTQQQRPSTAKNKENYWGGKRTSPQNMPLGKNGNDKPPTWEGQTATRATRSMNWDPGHPDTSEKNLTNQKKNESKTLTATAKIFFLKRKIWGVKRHPTSLVTKGKCKLKLYFQIHETG